MKKQYQKPTMRVVDIAPTKILCGSNNDTDYWGRIPSLGTDDDRHLA